MMSSRASWRWVIFCHRVTESGFIEHQKVIDLSICYPPIQPFRSRKTPALHLPEDMAGTFVFKNNLRDYPVGGTKAKINWDKMRETL